MRFDRVEWIRVHNIILYDATTYSDIELIRGGREIGQIFSLKKAHLNYKAFPMRIHRDSIQINIVREFNLKLRTNVVFFDKSQILRNFKHY